MKLLGFVSKAIKLLLTELVGQCRNILPSALCMIKIFREEGWLMGRGSSSERCLKWGGEGGGSLRDLSKNILKQGVGKGKKGGGGFEGVTTPVPPENFNHTPFPH